MNNTKHGLNVGMERFNDRFYLRIKAIGKLTHDDYKVITPFLDGALQRVGGQLVRVFFDATELDGWELRAAWDDFKMSLSHGNDFGRIAIVGHNRWHDLSSSLGSWFVAGECKYFEDYQEAFVWLHEIEIES